MHILKAAFVALIAGCGGDGDGSSTGATSYDGELNFTSSRAWAIGITQISVTGPEGGPFPSADRVFQLSNKDGVETIHWTGTSDADWLTFSQDSGTLLPGERVGVTIALDNAVADTLAAGSYHATANYVDASNPDSSIAVDWHLEVTPAEPPPEDDRVTDGLIALYEFEDGDGALVHDTSGYGAPMDLAIESPAHTSRVAGGLAVNVGTRIQSLSAATKLIDAATASNALTVEVWLESTDLDQNGPARIVSIAGANSAHDRNIMMGQGQYSSASDQIAVRCRTTTTTNDGTPAIATGPGSFGTGPTHVVFTRDAAGASTTYINGSAAVTGSFGGDLSNWDSSYLLTLANEADTDRSWLGALYLVAFYDRALSQAEVSQNLAAGAGLPDAGALTLTAGSVYANGPEGGPFSGTSNAFTVGNSGSLSIDWTASADESWVDLSNTGGTLAPGTTRLVDVTIGEAEAAALAPGLYSSTVTFTNTTDGFGSTTRDVSLLVSTTGGEVDVNFYVDASSGSDSNSGLQGAPWRTLAHAKAAATSGAVVGVYAGAYSLGETTASGRSEYLTFKAMPGPRPSLPGLWFDYENPTDTFLRVEGFEINSNGLRQVNMYNARHVELVDCDIHGDQWATGGQGVDAVYLHYCWDILIERCAIYDVFRGIVIAKTTRPTIRRNYVRTKAGTLIAYSGGNEDGVIEHNHLAGDAYTGYPTNPDAVESPHASIISIRSGGLTIRGNLMHGAGSSSGMMCYSPDAAGGEDAYSDLLIENNALYDTTNSNAVRIYNLGHNVVIRNNLFYSRVRSGTCPDGMIGNQRYRYYSPLTVHSYGPGLDGSGLELYNNIFIGLISVPNEATEFNNVVWAWGGATPLSMSPSGTSHIAVSTASSCGNHSTFFEDGFFANNPNLSFPQAVVADFSLDPNGLGANFGNPSVQPQQSLGSVGPDGFLRDDGPLRSSSKHSVGPYQLP